MSRLIEEHVIPFIQRRFGTVLRGSSDRLVFATCWIHLPSAPPGVEPRRFCRVDFIADDAREQLGIGVQVIHVPARRRAAVALVYAEKIALLAHAPKIWFLRDVLVFTANLRLRNVTDKQAEIEFHWNCLVATYRQFYLDLVAAAYPRARGRCRLDRELAEILRRAGA
jgi:hypothetical protein